MKRRLISAHLLPLVVFAMGRAGAAAWESRKEADVMCGPNSLLVVCQHLGVYAELEELKVLSGFDEKRGTTLLGLMQAIQVKGLRAEGRKIGLDDLLGWDAIPTHGAKAQRGAIVHLWGNHFVVVENGGPDAVKVTDTRGEPKTIPKKDFAPWYSGCALLIARDEAAFPATETKGPDLRADAYNWDFGFIEQGQQAGQVFTLENKGVKDLVLSKVETSCTCTQAFLPKETTIPPGGKGELTVGFDSASRQGGQSQIVYVYSNDPISPIVQLKIGGVIKPIRLPVSARSLHFGTVKKRDGATKEFSIRDPGDNSLTVSEVTSNSAFVKATLTRDEKQSLVYLVKAELKPGAPIGEFKSTLTVRSNHPKEPVVEIPVAAEVVGDIEVFPSLFFLGLLKKGQSASKTITLSTTAKERLKIKKIDSPFDYVEVKSKSEGEKYTLTATLKNTAPLGLIKGEVIVHTNNSDQPEIRIPLYALVEEQ